jgi:NAD(P)-dependent dehydrogenase (short-subunit alcohol dehydrogenase family)
MQGYTAPRVAVITGASSGIGLAAAKALASQGWRIERGGERCSSRRKTLARKRKAHVCRHSIAPMRSQSATFSRFAVIFERFSRLRRGETLAVEAKFFAQLRDVYLEVGGIVGVFAMLVARRVLAPCQHACARSGGKLLTQK